MKLPVFEIPIYKYEIENWEENKKSLMKILPDFLQKGDFTDYYDNQMASFMPLYANTVFNLIQRSMEDFAQYYPCPAQIVNMWCERSRAGDRHEPHNHGATGFSAVLYVQFEEGKHKPTRFFSPFGDPANGDLMQYEPDVKEGDLIIFPSFLIHESQMCDTDYERIIISFNIMGQDQYNILHSV